MMIRIMLILFLLLATPLWSATLYVIEDPLNVGKVRYLANTWPQADGSDGTGNTDIDAAWTAAGASGIVVLSGGAGGVTYSSTELDSDSYMSSGGANSTLRAAIATDPAYASHSGTVTLATADGANLLNTSSGGVTISGVTFLNAVTPAAQVIYTSEPATFTNCTFTADAGRVMFLVTGGTVVLVQNCTFGGTATGTQIQMLAGANSLELDTCTFNAQAAATVYPMVRIDGGTAFSMHGCAMTGSGVYVANCDFVGVTGVPTVTIQDNTFTDCPFKSLNIANYTTVTISGNEFTGGQSWAIGMGAATAGTAATHLIYNNYIHDMSDDTANDPVGIRCSGPCTVYYNLIYDIRSNGIDFTGGSANGSYAVNNIVYGSVTNHGFVMQSGASACYFANNISVKRLADAGQAYCWELYPSGSGLVVYTNNNLAYVENGSAAVGAQVMHNPDVHTYGGGGTGTWTQYQAAVVSDYTVASTNGAVCDLDATEDGDSLSLSANPLIVSTTDFHLQAGSPCIDAGTNLGATYDDDYDGKDQDLYGAGWEIGAYVYGPPAESKYMLFRK